MPMPPGTTYKDDAGQLSMDFLAGITLFMLGLILVVTMVSGILVHLQGKTTDYDAVAYRTAVILVEDPGYWGCEPPNCPENPPDWLLSRYTVPGTPSNSYANGSEWELLADDPALKPLAKRFGLYNSVEGGIKQPNRDGSWVLSSDKVENFFSTKFSDEDVYDKAVFGTGEVGKTVSFFDLYSPSWGQMKYNFNITLSIRQEDGKWFNKTRGPVPPDNTGYIKRAIKIKKASSAVSNEGPTIKITKSDYNKTSTNVLTMKVPFDQLLNRTFGQNYWLDIRNSHFFVIISNNTQFTISKIDIVPEGNATPPIDYANITLVEDGAPPVTMSPSGEVPPISGYNFTFSFPKTTFANESAFRPETTSYLNFTVGGSDGGGTGTFNYQDVTPIQLYDGILEVRIW